MSVREQAFKRVAGESDRLQKELSTVNKAATRKAAATGAWGAAVAAMTDGYSERMGHLANFCVEQHDWETKNDPWPARDRGTTWAAVVDGWVGDFAVICIQQYDADNHNMHQLAPPAVRNEMVRLVQQGRDAAVSSAKMRIGSRSIEERSSNIKRAQGLAIKVGTHAIAALGGWLLHLVTG